ncbi:MAG: hypothetical protein HQL16_03145 [Candidatus Omnitrophica bacterium]|nr:hypothetical protein [Candidatus Omnitrophota bacterium]
MLGKWKEFYNSIFEYGKIFRRKKIGAKKVLLLHPGYSIARHFNNYEAVLSVLDVMYGIKVEALVCNKAVSGCCLRGALGQLPDGMIKDWDACTPCQKKLRNRLKPFDASLIFLTDLVSDEDRRSADAIVRNLPNPVTVAEIIKLEVKGVLIGADIWQSIQRCLFIGSPKSISLIPGNVAYEYIKSGILYAYAMDAFFQKNRYDLILSNEVGYIDWGIPVRFALKNKIPVLNQNHCFYWLKMLTLRLNKSLEDLHNIPHVPTLNEFKNAVGTQDLMDQYIEKGRIALINFMGQADPHNKVRNDKKCREFFTGKKNVVIFTHLCWDGALAAGDVIFSTFEDWLTKTFEIASQEKDVNWIFRLHPAERELKTNSQINTLTHLNQLLKENPSSNIKIMDGTEGLKTCDILPFIHAGISVIGTVSMELPAHGVPCLLASRKGYAEQEFVISVKSVDDYVSKVRAIKDAPRPTKRQQELALAYAGLAFDKKRCFDVAGLFDTEDSSDSGLKKSRWNLWIKRSDNKSLIKKMTLFGA